MRCSALPGAAIISGAILRGAILCGATFSGAILCGGCGTVASDMGLIMQDFVPPSPRQAAEWALDPNDPENRRHGTTLLANAPWGGSDVYIEMYRDRVANETDPQVLGISIRALARWGQVDDAPSIASHLAHASREVRWEAARGLQRLHNPNVVAALTRRLGDEDESPDVRLECAIALGQYPQDRVFQALVTALDARELGINLEAEESLRLLTGADLGIDRPAWLAWYRQTADPFAAQEPYLYPTFSRRIRIVDRLVFWRPLVFETSAPPAGLRPEGARSTYEDRPPDTEPPTSSDGTRSTYGD